MTFAEYEFHIRLLMWTTINTEYTVRHYLNVANFKQKVSWEAGDGHLVTVNVWSDDDASLMAAIKSGHPVPARQDRVELFIKCAQDLKCHPSTVEQLKPRFFY